MDIISLEELNRIYWLGRYTERVYTTIREYLSGRDRMIENPDFYITYCQNFSIPNCYGSATDFLMNYAFDKDNPDSIVSNLNYAYDNAILLRQIFGTETLSYMELALNCLEHAKDCPAVMIELHKILDYILAFWARIEDETDSEQIRSVVKIGRYLERINLYLRLRKTKEDMIKPFHMMVAKLRKGYLTYDKDMLECLAMNVTGDEIDYFAAVKANEALIKEQYKCTV